MPNLYRRELDAGNISACFTSFEFEDERVLDLQETNPYYIMSQLLRQPNRFMDVSTMLSHRHMGDTVNAVVGIQLFGPSDTLTESFGLEYSTTNVLGWLRDSGFEDITFTDVVLRLGRLGLDHYEDLEPRNLTMEAHTIEAGLKQLDTVKPTDF